MQVRIWSNLYGQKMHSFCLITNIINNKKFHTTRHTFATNADEACMSTKALSEVLGHSSANITQNLYIHPSLNYKRVCMNNVYNKKTD